MSDFPKMRRQKWVTLPQALRWIMAREEPTPENWGTLPTVPDGDTSREDLFRHWIDGRLKLYGVDGFDPRRPWTPLTSSLTYKDDCREHTDYLWIRCDHIHRAGFDSIDWERGSLGRFFLEDREDGSHPYFVDLRVRWADLLRLKTGKELLGTVETEAQGFSAGVAKEKPVTDKKRGTRGAMRPDWPLMAALTAIVWEKEERHISTDDGTHKRVGRLLDGAKYECPGFERLPSRDNFICEAIVPTEKARGLLEKKTGATIGKERSRFRDKQPDRLPLACALIATIRESEAWETFSEDGVRERVTALFQAAGDCGPNSKAVPPGSDFISKALEGANIAKKLYEDGCREYPPTKAS